MILWERGPFGERRGVQAERRGKERRVEGRVGIRANLRERPAPSLRGPAASGFPIEKKPGASFRASFRRGSSTALYLNSPIKERFPIANLTFRKVLQNAVLRPEPRIPRSVREKRRRVYSTGLYLGGITYLFFSVLASIFSDQSLPALLCAAGKSRLANRADAAEPCGTDISAKFQNQARRREKRAGQCTGQPPERCRGSLAFFKAQAFQNKARRACRKS